MKKPNKNEGSKIKLGLGENFILILKSKTKKFHVLINDENPNSIRIEPEIPELANFVNEAKTKLNSHENLTAVIYKSIDVRITVARK